MESAKNLRWIIPFKKFGMVRVNMIEQTRRCFRGKEKSCFTSGFFIFRYMYMQYIIYSIRGVL